MGFLNKVAARNLFRYKKRALMTIFGIAGCTALVICGMGIRDTSVALSPKQYGHITRYDLLERFFGLILQAHVVTQVTRAVVGNHNELYGLALAAKRKSDVVGHDRQRRSHGHVGILGR